MMPYMSKIGKGTEKLQSALFPPLITLGQQGRTKRISNARKSGISPVPSKRESQGAEMGRRSSASPTKKRVSLTPLRIRPVQVELPWTLSELSFQKCIGKGSLGQILCAEGRNLCLAVKIIPKKPAKVRHCAEVERAALEYLQHQLIVQYHGCVEDDTHYYLILERLSRGDLFHITKRRKLRREEVRFYAGEVATVLRFIHAKGVVYRDLKPENVMIHESGHIRLIDFGFAKKIDGERTSTSLGSPEYMSPELVLRQPHNYAVDLWSYGVLLYEMYCQYVLGSHPPFQGPSPQHVYEKILEGRLDIPQHLEANAKDLIRKLLNPEFRQRPRIEDVMTHAYFRGLDWARVDRGEEPAPSFDEGAYTEKQQFQTDLFDDF